MDAGIFKGDGGGGRGKSWSQLLNSMTVPFFTLDDGMIGGGGGGRNSKSGSSNFFANPFVLGSGGGGTFGSLFTLASSIAAITLEAFFRKSEFSVLMLRRSTDSFSRSVALKLSLLIAKHQIIFKETQV